MGNFCSKDFSWLLREHLQEQMDADGPLFIDPYRSETCFKGQSVESCSEMEGKGVDAISKGSLFKNGLTSKPDFSLIEGDICLDNLSIRELQEAFRATFGRYTSVNDKLWLKRRIAMGLTNSCDVPSSNFTIKDNKFVFRDVKEGITSKTESHQSCSENIMMINATGLLNENEIMSITASQFEEQQASSTKEPENLLTECYEGNVSAHMEQCGAKRIRKPTKRYIEELSEFEVTECSGRVASLGRLPSHDKNFLKSKVSVQDLRRGYDARVPSVHRVRKRLPRKNFLALVKFVHMERDTINPGVLDNEQSPQKKHEKLSSSEGAPFYENSAAVQAMDVSAKRKKHQRAWTLGEVVKLVEGVSTYGAGRWSQIRQVAFTSGSPRTSVDLKDKWRNLLKASIAQLPTDQGNRSSRKPSSLPIPAPILLRVRELSGKHSQSGIDFDPSDQLVEHAGIVQEKLGFL